MIRSICIVSREYPPETAFGGIARMSRMTAQAFAQAGAAVHVISLAPDGRSSLTFDGGVTVHRLGVPPTPAMGCPEADEAIWAAYVAGAYRDLDALVRFDVVVGPDYFADTYRIEPGPTTLLAVQLHTSRAVLDPQLSDERLFPAERAAAELELSGIRRADLVIAPTELIAERTRALVDREIVTVAPPFDVTPFDVERRAGPHATQLVFVGRLEPNKQPELAIDVVLELRRRGVDAHLTLVGRDTSTGPGAQSYRRSVLLPHMRAQGGDYSSIRFVDQIDLAGVIDHLATADVAIVPSRFENLLTVAVEALATGTPVICGEDVGLACWVDDVSGLARIDTTSPGFASVAADKILDERWRREAGLLGKAAVQAAFDPRTQAAVLLDRFEQQTAGRRIPTAVRQPTALHPKLGIVMLAHNALAFTQRAIASVLEHTTVPFELVVVDNASTDGTAAWLSSIDDPRVRPVTAEKNYGVSGGRNIGLDNLSGAEELVVFLDNDVEVFAEWWTRAAQIFSENPLVGIVGEDGVRVHWSDGTRQITEVAVRDEVCDVVVGFCMFMRTETVARIGRFDEGLGLFWHDDDEYAMRATRIGETLVAAKSGRILHFEHKSSSEVAGIWEDAAAAKPADLSARNLGYLAGRRRRQTLSPETPFVVVTDLEAIEEDPTVLSTYLDTFTAADASVLAICTEIHDQAVALSRVNAAANRAGIALEGAQLTLMAPGSGASPDRWRALADEAYCALVPSRPLGPGGAFAHLAWIRPGETTALRVLAARAWAARPAHAPAASTAETAGAAAQ